MSTAKTALYSFILGGVAGGALALLFAPSSGEETRKRVKEGLKDAREKAEGACMEIAGCVEEGKGRVQNLIAGRKEDIMAAIEAGKEAYMKGRERLIKGSA